MIWKIDENSYVPTLAVRPSEMNGLEMLPGPTKDRLCPIFLLAPWVNSAVLDNSLKRIGRAFSNRGYFLDLDRHYQYDRDNPTSAQAEFRRLFEAQGDYSNWLDFIEAEESVHPCIQMSGQDEGELVRQIERVREMGRRFCVRIEMRQMPENLNYAVSALRRFGAADFIIAIDAGWVRNADVNAAAADMLGLINGPLDVLDSNVPLIISLTTIPKTFNDIEGVNIVEFDNRRIVEQVRRQCNFYRVAYGDWGSTRPRTYEHARRPLPRIDYPVESQWLFARGRNSNWDYSDAARAINETPEWNENRGLNIWGERMIEMTAVDSNLGINTPQKNVASRVNIHLHRQAFYGETDLGGLNLDEPWED